MTAVATHGVIDQRGMTAGERFDLACELRACWWDCCQNFLEEIVDVRELGLLPQTMTTLADDLEAAGYGVHAAAVREATLPTPSYADRPVAGPWCARTHTRARRFAPR